MNKITLLIFSIFTLISCKTSEVIVSVKNGLVIENARIISPENQSISSSSYIVIDGSDIIFVGIQKPHLKGTFKTVDAKSKYIIPGLIDSHVHVTSTDALSDKEELENPELVKSFRNQLPKSYLYFGYTTLIDLGTKKPERLSEFKNAIVKPDLYYVGGGAVIGNGYGLSNWNDEIPNFIYQENEAYPIPDKYKKENHTAKAVVSRIASSGAIAVKTYYEPGFDPTQAPLPTPSEELIKKIKTETQKNGLLLVAHGNSLEAHNFLGKAKVDIIAHGLWNWENYSLDNSNDIPEAIKKTLNIEIENNVGYMPTLQVINGLRSLTNAEFLDNPELQHVLPKQLIEHYKANADAMYTNVFGSTPKALIINNFNRLSNQGKINLKYMYDHNGVILFGTDTPSSPTFGNPPGYNGYMEMLEMESAGVPLSQILASATIDNAKAFKLENLYGTVEQGKKANLLILNKNPLQDIRAYNDISQVIIQGIIWNRSTLSVSEIEE